MHLEEFNNTYFNEELDFHEFLKVAEHQPSDNENIADAFDWTDNHAVSPVRDQGSCESCWAFSAATCLEGLNYLKRNISVTLSIQ